jgi:signal transduction histidine kinase
LNPAPPTAERILILAPRGRDAGVANSILSEAGIGCDICADLIDMLRQIRLGADTAIITEETFGDVDTRTLTEWVGMQPPWSDFPFILLTSHGGGIERNPTAALFTETLGNVTFLERPFHPTTLISVAQAGLRGRRRQHECRRLNEELELRVTERTGELAAANRQLLAQIEEREKVESTLRQMQRLEAVGQLTSGVAHDFNNLLTVVLGNIMFMERGLRDAGIDGKLAQRLVYIRVAAERGAKLTDQLLAFSRRQRLEPKALDLNEIITGMRDLLQSTMGGSIRIDTLQDSNLWSALVDSTQLELAVLNLAINARDAMELGGNLVVATANVTLGSPQSPEEPPAGDYVSVGVSDNGSGMSDAVRRKVFEPFFTTREVGKGSGLGLSQVLGFAKQSGGGVRIRSVPGKGTSVFVYLPRTRLKPATGKDARTETVGVHAGGASILLVDDDSGVREVTAEMLRGFGYEVLEAGSGGAALDLVQRAPKIDLMLIDFAMPDMSGADVARSVHTTKPALPTLYITGYADHRALRGVSETHIIGKPFTSDELAYKVRAALAESGGHDWGR